MPVSADRITLRIAPAIQTLRDLPLDDPIDLAFIDADKTGYASYYEEILTRHAPGGVILVDNTLWSGRVLDDARPTTTPSPCGRSTTWSPPTTASRATCSRWPTG